MSTLKKLIFLLLLTLPTLATAKNFFPEGADELEAAGFWGQAYFKPGTNTGVMDFRAWFEAPPKKVFETLTDTNNLQHWLTNYNTSRTLTREIFKHIEDARPQKHEDVMKIIEPNYLASHHNRQRGKDWTDYIFLEFNFPWPVNDRWAVHKVKVDESNHKKDEYKYEYKMTVGNLKTLTGWWELLPVPGKLGWTEFRGHYESDPGIVVPHFITKSAMRAGVKKDVDAYRELFKKR